MFKITYFILLKDYLNKEILQEYVDKHKTIKCFLSYYNRNNYFCPIILDHLTIQKTRYSWKIKYMMYSSVIHVKILKLQEKYVLHLIKLVTYFIDMQGIGGGQEFPLELATAIRDCSLFLFLASKNSYHSKFTDAEITFAFKKKKRNQIIPYIIDNSELPIQLEFVFSSINWCTQKSHPIEPDLVNDILSLLNHSAPELEQKVEKYPKKKNTLLLQKVKILNLIEKYKKG